MNRKSERIPRRMRRGKRANHKQTEFHTVEDSPPLAAGSFKIAYVYYDLPQIMPIHSFEVICELAQRGHQVSLFACLDRTSRLCPELAKRGVNVIGLPYVSIRFLSEAFFLLNLLVFLLWFGIRSKPDLLYIRHASASVVGGFVGKLLRIPVCVEVNDILLKRTETQDIPRLKRLWVLFYEALAFSLADKILPVTDGIKEWICTTHGVAREAVRTVPNGVNVSRFHPGDPIACRRKFGLPLQATIVGYLGSLFHWSGLDYLIDAARTLVPAHPEVLFVIGGGEEPYLSHLIRKAADCNLSAKFRFLGGIDWSDASDLINTFDISVAPAYFRNLESGISAQKVLAYLACGKPVVGSDIHGLGDFLEENGIGRAFKMGDAGGLAEALGGLLSDPEDRRRLGSHCRPFVLRHLSWTKVTADIERVLMELRSRNRRAVAS